MTNYTRKPLEDWTLCDNFKFHVQRVFNLIRWRIQRGELTTRYNDQFEAIRQINLCFAHGWRIYGNGELPRVSLHFSKAFASTCFSFVDCKDETITSYHYRIGNHEVNNDLGIYCQSTDEEFALNVSDQNNLEIYLMIAAASVALLVDGDIWTPKRCQDIYDGIAISMGLVQDEVSQ